MGTTFRTHELLVFTNQEARCTNRQFVNAGLKDPRVWLREGSGPFSLTTWTCVSPIHRRLIDHLGFGFLENRIVEGVEADRARL